MIRWRLPALVVAGVFASATVEGLKTGEDAVLIATDLVISCLAVALAVSLKEARAPARPGCPTSATLGITLSLQALHIFLYVLISRLSSCATLQ